jgi:chromosome partitioning protein
MSMRITFLNQKGGVGKSTAAALVAAVLQRAGFRVAIDDRDPQKSLEFWAAEVGGVPLLAAEPKPEVIITDTPGRLDLQQAGVLAAFTELVQSSQRIVLVTEKTLFSLHASAPMLRVIQGIQGPQTKVQVLFNKVRRSTCIGRQSEADLARRLGIEALAHPLPLASAFERMETEGLKAVTGKLLEQAQALALELVS